MKRLGFGIIFLILIAMLISCYFGKLQVYTPASEEISITISEIEKGNHLIELSEANIILLIMLVGAFLIVR